jgi:L,D-transpeptidase ErfK/SrfK
MTAPATVDPQLPPTHRPELRWPRRLLAAAIFALVITTGLAVVLGDRTTVTPLDRTVRCGAEPEEDSAPVRRARQRLAALRPSGRYIVIDSHRNLLRVFEGDRLLREAVCSAGSGTVLVHPSGTRTWTFDTPLGERRVIRKVRDPVWSKPDWAFIEEGFEPPDDPSLRIDSVSLGDYALYLGDGYIIHGTLFQTLLGQGVTHGCIRLGDEDLEYVYRTIPVGARVYLH